MPITYSVYEDRRLLVSIYTGVISTQELLAHVARLGSDPRLRPGYRAVADLGGVEGGTVTLNGMLAIVDEVARSAARLLDIPLAIVAPRDEAYGVGRTYAMLSEHQRSRVQVFRNRQEASGWLGMVLDLDQPRSDEAAG